MKLRPISLLPSVNQTDALKRFFGSTVDQLFQPGDAQPVSGFIGRVPDYNNPATDFYKTEPTATRQLYQLEAMMVSELADKSIGDMLFYDDLLARLSQAGALISDPNRLFSSGYYSWAPPVDIDKLNNFNRYYWSDDSIPALDLTLPGMEVPAVYRADGLSTTFLLPPSLLCWRILPEDQITENGVVFDGCPQVLVNGQNTSFSLVNGVEIQLSAAPATGDIIEVYRYGNIGDGSRVKFAFPNLFLSTLTFTAADVHVYINGRPVAAGGYTVDLANGFITLATPAPANMPVTVTIFNSIEVLADGQTYFDITNLNTQGVTEMVNGLKVNLIDPNVFFLGFDIKPYDTFKWDEHLDSEFFVDGVGVSIYLTPISDMLIGSDPQHIVVARDDLARSYWSRINLWVTADALAWIGAATTSRQATRPICEYVPNMAMFNYGRNRAPNVDCSFGITSNVSSFTISRNMLDENGNICESGDVILFGDIGNPIYDNKFFIWPIIDDETDTSTVSLTFLQDANDNDVIRNTATNNEYWLNNGVWQLAQPVGQFPLFDLFDDNGISIGDTAEYPKTNFIGSRIFCFEVGTGLADSVMGFPVVYDTYGAFMFENDQYTQTYTWRDGTFTGFTYYLIGASTFENQWYRSPNLLPAIGTIDNSIGSVNDGSANIVVPLNLQANPNMGTPQFISRNNWFQHFASIEANQADFTGKAYSDNNWQYTAKDLSLGTKIVQPFSPLLKTMLLLADSNFDLSNALAYAETEYTRFKLKIRQKIKDNNKLGLYASTVDADTALDAILQALVANKTGDFAYFLSNIAGGHYFIPPTAATIGITPMVNPIWIVENGVSFLLGHDGSKTASIDPITDAIMLAFEQRIFTSRAQYVYVAETRPLVDEYNFISGKYRASAYSREETNVVQQSMFEDWARANNGDYQSNDTYDHTNPFTWNYAELSDQDGAEIPGNWRGIYRWYFDTDAPHTAPWEMLGFAEQPTWWIAEYGVAPYTRYNSKLWGDCEAGLIRQGPRAGTDVRFARPNLMSVLPVDISGNLLDPIQARIVAEAPPIQFAQEPWVFGDGSPIENLWRRSSAYPYAKAYSIFLMRPADFVESYWDVDNRKVVHGTQVVDLTTNDRPSSSELYVHGETLPDGTVKVSNGIQSWIAEAMINRGQSTSILGNLVRGLNVRLAHKMAAFTTTDRLQLTAESFGIVPAEDIQIALYNSPSISNDFYSGVIIEMISPDRWRVIGYNPIDPYFDTFPVETGGLKLALTNVTERIVNPWLPNVYYKMGMYVLYKGFVYECLTNHTSSSAFETAYWIQDEAGINNDEKLYQYLDYQEDDTRVPYTTVFTTRQDVINFLYSYQYSLVSRGFSFTEGSWADAVQKFINWSKVKWAKGSFITLSPAARSISYTTPTGYVLDLEGPGASNVVNRTGHAIDNRNLTIDRLDGQLDITATGDDIYGINLRTSDVEHCLVFSNTTIFGDIIYDPILNVRQPRLKMNARCTTDWEGRYNAPGFILSGGQIVSNFAKSADDLRYMFDIELADNTVLRDHARHLIGFEARDYLTNLLLSETQQFELYQGMIQQKGAPGSFTKILRSRAVEGNRQLQFMEEWAFRIGEFGPFNPRGYFEIELGASDLLREQQVIHLNATALDQNGILSVSPTDSRWIDTPIDFSALSFDPDADPTVYGLPNAGYIRTSEATYAAMNTADFTTQAQAALAAGTTYAPGETVWLYHQSDTTGWSVLSIQNPPIGETQITAIDNPASNGEVIGVRFTLNQTNNFAVGDYVLINGPAGDDYTTAGLFTVANVGSDWFEIDLGDVDADNAVAAYDFVALEETGPDVFRVLPSRFPNRAAMATFTTVPNTLVYIDDNGNGKWAVYNTNDMTTPVRSQPRVMDARKVAKTLIYDQKTAIGTQSLSPEPITVARITPIDPMVGAVVGVADKEVDYKLEYDPASYDLDATLWTDQQVGTLWWDMSTTFFINQYTDDLEALTDSTGAITDVTRYLAELEYRSINWSRLATGSTVDIYEWTVSTSEPAVNDDGTLPPFNTVVGEDNITYYYYWVLNPSVVPVNSIGRTLDAQSVSDILSNPSASEVPWMAIISHQDMLISGVRTFLTDDTTALQVLLQLTDQDEDVPHRQWMLIRPGDETSLPTATLLQKLRDSLTGFDDNLAPIPSPALHVSARTGIEAAQSMFDADEKVLARNSYITMLNYQLARSNLGANVNFGADMLNYNTPIDQYLTWTLTPGSRTLALLPPPTQYDMITYDPGELDDILNAATTSIRVLLDNRYSDNPGWSVWEKVVAENGYGNPGWVGAANDGTIQVATRYDVAVADLAARDAMAANIQFGTKVLVNDDANFDDFWTIYLYGANGWTVIDAQTYRTSDFWEYVDWYADGYDDAHPPLVSYATSADRNKAENPNPTNTLVKILDNGDGYWTWTAYVDGNWTTVAQQLGTVQISTKYYENTATLYGTDFAGNYVFDGDNVRYRDGTMDLRVLFDAILDNAVITNLEVNELWFSIVNFIHAHHDQVDWAFKTSFLTLVGLNEQLTANPVQQPDNTDDILSYIEEVKPYHVTVRDYNRSLSPETDVGMTTVTDFDKPLYYDEALGAYRVFKTTTVAEDGYGTSPSINVDAGDEAIMEAGVWSHWLDNMALARNFKITMLLDRFWFQPNEPGAAQRIQTYYQPTAGMPANDYTALLHLDFKGTVLEGTDFATIAATTVQGADVSDNGVDINGDAQGTSPEGFELTDPRVAANTPEELVRLGSHDVFLLRGHDKWGAGSPRSIVHTYNVENETDQTINLPLGMLARDVVVFFDGVRGIQDTDYAFSQLASQITGVVLVRDNVRTKRVTIQSFSYAANTTIIDQVYLVGPSNDDLTMPVPQKVLDYGSDYYVEVTNNGRYIATSIVQEETTQQWIVNFQSHTDDHFVFTFYKGTEMATTRLMISDLATPANPNGTAITISPTVLVASTDYSNATYQVDQINRYLYVAGPITVNGLATFQIKDFDTNQLFYTGNQGFQFKAIVQGTSVGVAQDAELIGASDDPSVRYRVVQILDMNTLTPTSTFGQNGIFASAGDVKMSGTGASTIIPETTRMEVLNNALTGVQTLMMFLPGQTRFYDLSGNLLRDISTDIGWDASSFVVKLKDTLEATTAWLVNPNSTTHPVVLITVSVTNGISYRDYTVNGLSGFGTGQITAVAYDTSGNVIIWFSRTLGGEIVAKYSLITENMVWVTDGDFNSSTSTWTNPMRMNYSRVDGVNVCWIGNGSVFKLTLTDGTVQNIGSTAGYVTNEAQHWDEETGRLVTTNADGNTHEDQIWSYNVYLPDSAYTASFTLDPSNFSLIHPYNSSMMVELNGMRLAPPRTNYAVNTDALYLEDMVPVADMLITDDTGTTMNVVQVADSDYDSVDAVKAANRSERYILWTNYLVFRDADAETRTYALVYAGSGDFTIDEVTGILTVYALHTTDVVRVLHWRNDGVMLPQTWSFKAVTSGTYKIKTTKNSPSWVTINGLRLVENVDYYILPTEAGAWDVEAFDTFGYDDATEVDLTIKNTLGGDENDLVVITTFEGSPNSEALEWQLSTTTPDIYRFRAIETAPEGQLDIVPNAWATETSDIRREGGALVDDFAIGDSTFTIEENPEGVPSIMQSADPVSIPDASANNPGVIWLGEERIEYFKRSVANNIVTLDQVRRGTKGTPKVDHAAGKLATWQHPLRKVPALPRGDISPIPTASLGDTPYVPYTPPVFEGWYFKMRVLCDTPGRDAGDYGWLWSFPNFQPNPPYGNYWNGITYVDNPNQHETGAQNTENCTNYNLCGQLMIQRTGGPYDWTLTFYYDIPPGNWNLLIQFGYGNWSSIGHPEGSPFHLEYQWWDQPGFPYHAYDGQIGGLWPYYYNFDVPSKPY